MTDIKPRKTQLAEAEFWAKKGRIFNNSDPGTGKTWASLLGYQQSIAGRLLVVAPLTILRSSWGDDINRFMPGFTWAVAHGTGNTAKKRQAAFDSNADIVLINHDGVDWLTENRHVLKGFSHCVIDEYTAFKNRTANRSKAALRVVNDIENLTMLSGTAIPKSITDIWHPALMVDGGKRLGNQYFRFRAQVCTPLQVGPDPQHVQWVDKPGAVDQVTNLLSDITIRHELEDVPENIRYNMFVDMPRQIMDQYKELEREAVLETENGVITAINAGVKVKKMLQLLSGAAYDSTGRVIKIHNDRIELVMDLVDARDQCVVAYNWAHELAALEAMAKKLKMPYFVINGDPKEKKDIEVKVRDFQAGKYKVVFCHPQSAAHGLTLTAAKTTIWSTPTYNAEHFIQFNRRIHRRGQTEKTETICICARDTREEDVYEKLGTKIHRVEDLLSLFTQFSQAA